MRSSFGGDSILVSPDPQPLAAVAQPASPRRPRPRRRLAGGAVLAKLVDDPAGAPEWLKLSAATLEAAARPKRSVQGRAADLLNLLSTLDQLYAARLPELQTWFESNATTGHTLTATLPRWAETLFAESGALLRDRVLPGLAAAGATVLPMSQVDEWQRDWLHQYFLQSVYPLLIPLAVDQGRPFPYISSDSLNLLVELRPPDALAAGLRGERVTFFARVKIPASTPRLVALPRQAATGAECPGGSGDGTDYVCSADLVRTLVHHLITGMQVRRVYLFRVVRGETPLPVVGGRSGRHRRQEDQPVVRLDVERAMADSVLRWLTGHLAVPAHGVARHDNLLEATCLPYVVELARTLSAKR